jgi:hypothetical protein
LRFVATGPVEIKLLLMLWILTPFIKKVNEKAP